MKILPMRNHSFFSTVTVAAALRATLVYQDVFAFLKFLKCFHMGDFSMQYFLLIELILIYSGISQY